MSCWDFLLTSFTFYFDPTTGPPSFRTCWNIKQYWELFGEITFQTSASQIAYTIKDKPDSKKRTAYNIRVVMQFILYPKYNLSIYNRLLLNIL